MTPQSKPIRVLVVDDDDMSRELLGVLLEGEGYAVESANSGEAALNLLRLAESATDLVLADVQMPGISGPQLARKLRSACGQATLLLAISGSQPSAETISHFDGFLLKPFRMEQVAAALLIWQSRASVVTPPRREKRTASTGSARTSRRQSKLISIAASASKTASNKVMKGMVQEVQSQPSESVASEAEGEIPILNEKIYQQLAGSMPSRQLHEMYAMCVNDARDRIATMRKLAAEHDTTRFSREAHSIKGGCGMLGATELHRMAAQLEVNGLAVQPNTDAQEVNSLDELSAACDRLERMLISRV